MIQLKAWVFLGLFLFQLLVAKFRYFCCGHDGTARFIELLLCAIRNVLFAMFFVLCAMCYCMILVSRCKALDFIAI
ncbi:hypothetical protein M0804_015012 [Polistes exclamans]|nr:hypothetical protein M0804_015012 [Polistes exclamans]